MSRPLLPLHGCAQGKHCLSVILSCAQPIPTPPPTPLAPQAGKVPDAEMFRTFNMGIGMVVVVPRSEVDTVLGLGLGAFEIGEIVEGSGVELV